MEQDKPDDYEVKITKFEKYINLTWGVLKRNWGKLLVLSLLAFIIWFCMLVKAEVENPSVEQEFDYYPAETYPEDSIVYEDSIY